MAAERLRENAVTATRRAMVPAARIPEPTRLSRRRRRILIAVGIALALVILFGAKLAVDHFLEGKRRTDRLDETKVIVHAPKNACWEVESYDERLQEGNLDDIDEDELTSSDEYDIRDDQHGEAHYEGCGTDTVTLPADIVPGAVYLTLRDRVGHRHHPVLLWALMAWLKPDGTLRGGGTVTPDAGKQEREFVAVFTKQAPAVFGGNRYDRKKLADASFPVPAAVRFSKTEVRDFNAAGADLTAFTRDVATAAKRAVAATSEADTAAALADLYDAINTAQHVKALIAWDVPATYDWEDPTGADMANVLAQFDRGKYGATAKKLAPALRRGIANDRLAWAQLEFDRRPTYYASVDEAWAILQPLLVVDPARAGKYRALHRRWLAAEAAGMARLEAELDAWRADLGSSGGGSGGGYYPGCDGDGDGICFE